jgi:hypothetical protein
MATREHKRTQKRRKELHGKELNMRWRREQRKRSGEFVRKMWGREMTEGILIPTLFPIILTPSF